MKLSVNFVTIEKVSLAKNPAKVMPFPLNIQYLIELVRKEEKSLIMNQFTSEQKAKLDKIVTSIHQLPQVSMVMLYGSYAKGEANKTSDVDLAVFFEKEPDDLLEEYRALVQICSDPQTDYQVQAFSNSELIDPCGIVEEVLSFGQVLKPVE